MISMVSFIKILVLSLLLFLGYSMTTKPSIKPTPSTDTPILEEMINAKATLFNEVGQIEQQIYIQKMIQKKSDLYTYITEPVILINQKKGGYWRLQAKQGKSRQKFSIIELFNDVRINSENGILRTEKMTLYPQAKKMSTHNFISINNPIYQITSTGFVADLHTQKMVFLKNVQTTYHYPA